MNLILDSLFLLSLGLPIPLNGKYFDSEAASSMAEGAAADPPEEPRHLLP